MFIRLHPLVAGLALASLASVLGLAQAGTVQVSYVHPQQFADLGRNPADRAQALEGLTRHLTAWGERLPGNQTLKLDVLDVDLAGELELLGRWQEVRVLRGRADWPHIRLRWTLQADGRTLNQGEAQLSDLGYTLGGPARRHTDLGYEKHMLDRWFSAQFNVQDRR